MLLTLPPELLTHVALHLATLPPNLGPPAALLPLLVTCRRVYELLGRNRAFWARVGRAKFSFADEEEAAYVPYEGYPYVGLKDMPDSHCAWQERGKASTTDYLAYSLRTRCAALTVIRAGDPFAHGAARALRVAYAMLLEDNWDGERFDWTALDMALGRDSLPPRPDTFASTLSRAGKNRRQLTWAHARAFALKYVLERLYLGRYGDLDPDAADSSSDSALRAHAAEVVTEYRQEWKEPAWRVGWPRDAEGTAAALWVLWFFESDETLRAEPEALRRHLMNLFRPLVAAPFRYPSALAPPHHYSVPLLPSVFTSSAFETQREGQGGITIPTNHGAYPIYALGAPTTPSEPTSALRASSRPRSSSSRRSSRSRSRSRSPRPSSSRLRPSSKRRSRSPSSKRPSTSSYSRPLDRRYDGTHARSRILAAPPARLLFFARMQVGARMGVPPHLPKNREEAAGKWRAAGNTGPMPIGPTQQDVHEKNARPLVRFERRLLPATPSSTSTAGPSTNAGDLMTPAPAPVLTSAETLDLLAVDPELDLDYASGPARTRRRDERWAPYRWRARLCRGPASRQGKGGAPPGRIGRVYRLGSLAGLWSGTMLMPPEQPYNALVATPGGALPHGGLRDESAAVRPVYMRVREHWSFHPDTPAPPHAADSTTADEGLRHGWFPFGTRVVGVGGGKVEVAMWRMMLTSVRGCVRARERERWRREVAAGADVAAASADEDVDMEEEDGNSLPAESASPSVASVSASEDDNAADAPWPEWNAPAWKAHAFDDDEGWEWHCDGVQDVIFEGETDARHGMAWHHYEYVGRVRPWDGLIGLIMRPRDRTLGLSMFFISGFLRNIPLRLALIPATASPGFAVLMDSLFCTLPALRCLVVKFLSKLGVTFVRLILPPSSPRKS
ncbi:hypothetical protein MSAN_02074500 [Mycena sanguinolenta]|uniref:F-box domain-containing protein n=1 Tax=Mycena sanguinolenta TaxID=230812 RepID=A0A8H7CMU9_9AGAR|nr:hypothetical protein MSAN_02074500 [Mycena sanguinolenta]